ncbi:MAG: hypothetical protein ACI4FX_02035 [Agathobacter sp.]
MRLDTFDISVIDNWILLCIGWIISLGTPKCQKSGCHNDAKKGSIYQTVYLGDINILKSAHNKQ